MPRSLCGQRSPGDTVWCVHRPRYGRSSPLLFHSFVDCDSRSQGLPPLKRVLQWCLSASRGCATVTTNFRALLSPRTNPTRPASPALFPDPPPPTQARTRHSSKPCNTESSLCPWTRESGLAPSAWRPASHRGRSGARRPDCLSPPISPANGPLSLPLITLGHIYIFCDPGLRQIAVSWLGSHLVAGRVSAAERASVRARLSRFRAQGRHAGRPTGHRGRGKCAPSRPSPSLFLFSKKLVVKHLDHPVYSGRVPEAVLVGSSPPPPPRGSFCPRGMALRLLKAT